MTFSTADQVLSPSAPPSPSSAGSPPRPGSPTPRRSRAPSWLDLRLVVGVLLVLGSVVIGARVVASSDDRVGVWAATRPLAPGTVLSSADLVVSRVRLPSTAAYFPDSADLVGKQLTSAVSDGELLPRTALATPPASVTVTVPVSSAESPSIDRGQRITVWVSTQSCRAVVVLPDVVVQAVDAPRSGSLSSNSKMALTIRVEPALAARTMRALDLPSAVIRIGVLDGASDVPVDLGDLDSCDPQK